MGIENEDPNAVSTDNPSEKATTAVLTEKTSGKKKKQKLDPNIEKGTSNQSYINSSEYINKERSSLYKNINTAEQQELVNPIPQQKQESENQAGVLRDVRKKLVKLYAPRAKTLEDAKYLEPGEQVPETNNQYLKKTTDILKDNISTLETNEYERQIALSEFISHIELKDDGSKIEHYKKDLTDEQKRRAVVEFSKWNATLKDSYDNYLNSYKQYKSFMDSNKDLELTKDEVNVLTYLKNFGSDAAKQYTTDTELYAAVSEYRDNLPRNEKTITDMNVEKPQTDSRGFTQQKTPAEQEAEMEKAARDEFNTKDHIDLLLGEITSNKKLLTLKNIGVSSVIEGAWDGTVGTVGQWLEVLGADVDASDFMFRNWSQSKTRANNNFLKEVNPELFRLGVSVKENADLKIYDNDFSKFVDESMNQFGQMGAFIMQMGLTGALGLSSKLAIESEQLAKTLTLGKFLKAALTKGTFKTPLVQTYLKNGLAGLTLTYPGYYLEAEKELEKIPKDQRTWLDYTGFVALPIIKGMLEGMSEATGAHFLGGAIGKVFGGVSAKILPKFIKENPLLKAVDSYFTHQVLAENVGEVMEERINGIIDYAKYAITGKYTGQDGKEYSNFGDFLKNEFKKSAYEFAMFSASSLFYGKMLGMPKVLGSAVAEQYATTVEGKFEQYLSEKYPELLKVNPTFFKDFKNTGEFFFKTIKERFDAEFEKSVDIAAKELFLDKRLKENEETIKKFATDLMSKKSMLSQNDMLYAADRMGFTPEIIKGLQAIDPTLPDDLSKVSKKEGFEIIWKLNNIVAAARVKLGFEKGSSVFYRPETEYQKSTIEFLDNPDLTIEQREKISNAITAYSEIAKERAYESRNYSSKTTRFFGTLKNRIEFTLGKEIKTFDANHVNNFNDENAESVSAREIWDKSSMWGDPNPIDSDISDFVEQYIDENGVDVVFVDNFVGNLDSSAYVKATSNRPYQRKRIYFNPHSKYIRDPKVAIVHEVLHLAFQRAIINNPELAGKIQEFRDRYNEVYKESLTNAEIYMLGGKEGKNENEKQYNSIKEFVTMMFDDTTFKERFDSMDLSLIDKLGNILNKIFPTIFAKKSNYEALKQILLTHDTEAEVLNPNYQRHLDMAGYAMYLPSPDFTYESEFGNNQNKEKETNEEKEIPATVTSPTQIPLGMKADKVDVLFAGEEGRKKELEVDENDEDIFDEIETSLTNVLDEMSELGITFGKTTEELYNIIQDLENAGTNNFATFEQKFKESLNLLTDEQKQQFNIWLDAKNIEYKDKLADTSEFLEWVYANALTIDKIDYCVIKQKGGKEGFKGLEVERKTKTFSDASKSNKTLYGKRPLYRQHQAELKKKGITFEILEVNHFVTNSDAAESEQIKFPNLRSFRIAKNATDNATDILTTRLVREGYIPLYTGGRTLLIIPISSIKIVEKGVQLDFFHPYYDNNQASKSNPIYVSQLSSTVNGETTSFLNYVMRKLAAKGREKDYLDVLMEDAYPSDNPDKYYDAKKKRSLTVGEFLQQYIGILSSDKRKALNPLTDPRDWKNPDTGINAPFSTHATFLQVTADLMTTFFWRRLVFGPLLPGIGVDNEKGNKSDLEVFKRVSSLNGYSPKSFLSERIKNIINKQNKKETSGIWVEGNKVMVRSMVLDTETLPKEMRPEGIENTGASEIGNGSTFQTSFAQKILYALNRVFVDKQGTVSKSKVFKDGLFIKNGTHKAHSWELKDKTQKQSLIAEFMRLNQLAEIHLTSAVKVGENTLGVQRITWQDILDKKIFETKERDEKYAFTRNLMDNIWIQDGASKNKIVGGLMPILIRTYLASIMPSKIQKDVLDVHRSLIEKFNNEVTNLADNPEALRKSIYDFAQSMPFNSEDKQFILKFLENSDNDLLSYIPQIKEYFVNGRMTKTVRGLYSFRQKGGYPVMTPDMGNLTQYREMLIDTGQITEEQAKEYFDSNGFLKRGFAILDSDTAKKLGLKRGDKAIWVNNPPAGLQDIKPIIYIGSFKGRNAVVLNTFQAQEVSGKDYDFDKVLILKATNSKQYEAIWDWLKQQNFEEKFIQIKKDFLNSIPEQQRNRFNKLTDDPVTALFLHHFGVSSLASEKITFDRPYIFSKLAAILEKSPIEEVYNIGVYLTLLHNADNQAFYEEYDEFGNFVQIRDSMDDVFGEGIQKLTQNTVYPVKLGTSNDPKELERRMAIMSFMTHHSLDWQSDPKLLLYDYTPEKLLKLLLGLHSEEAAKDILDKLRKEINPIKNITKPSFYGVESISEMKESLKAAKSMFKRFIEEGSFFDEYIENLGKIDYGNLDFNALLTNVTGFDAKLFNAISQTHNRLIKILGSSSMSVHNEVLNRIKLFACLFRVLSKPSDYFSTRINLQKIIDSDSNELDVFNNFMKSMLSNDLFTVVRKDTRIANLNSKGSLSTFKLLDTFEYKGTGRSLVINAKGDTTKFGIVEYKDGKLLNETYYDSFKELYNNHSELIDRYLQTEQSQHFFANLFTEENESLPDENKGIFEFKTSTESRNLVKSVLLDSFKLFAKSKEYAGWTEAHKARFFFAFLGSYDNTWKANNEIDNEIDHLNELLRIENEKNKNEKEKTREQKALEGTIKELYYKKMPSSFLIHQTSKTSLQSRVSITEKEYQKLKAKGNVRLEIEQVANGGQNYYKVVPASFINYAPAINLLETFYNNEVANESLAKEITQTTIESAKQSIDNRQALLDTGESTKNAIDTSNELGMMEFEDDAESELRRMLKNNSNTKDLTEVEIEHILTDLYNIKKAKERENEHFSMANYLSNLLFQSSKGNKWADSWFNKIFGISLYPGNRIVNMLSDKNILVSSVKNFTFSVMGKLTGINANFMQNLQDKHARLGRPELLSGSQINHAFNTQIHYAYEDASRDALYHFKEMMAIVASSFNKKAHGQILDLGEEEQDEVITISPLLQAIAYDIANMNDTYNTLTPYVDPLTKKFATNGQVMIKNEDGTSTPYQFVNTYERFYESSGEYRIVYDMNNNPIYQHYVEGSGWTTTSEGNYNRLYELNSRKKFNKAVLFGLATRIYENNEKMQEAETLLQTDKAKRDSKDAMIKTIIAGICQNYIVTQVMPQYEYFNIIDLEHALERAKNTIKDKNELGKFKTKVRKLLSQANARLSTSITTNNMSKMPVRFQNANMEKKSLFWLYAVADLEKENLELKLVKEKPLEITKELIQKKINEQKEVYNKRFKQEKRRTNLTGLNIKASEGITFDNTTTQYNLKTLDLLEQHIQATFNFYRSQMLELHQEINNEYLQKDNAFSIKEARFQNQIIRNGLLSKKPVKWENLKKGMGIYFRQKITKQQLIKEKTTFLGQKFIESFKAFLEDAQESDPAILYQIDINGQSDKFYKESDIGRYISSQMKQYDDSMYDGANMRLLRSNAAKKAVDQLKRMPLFKTTKESQAKYNQLFVFELVNEFAKMKTEKEIDEYFQDTGETEYQRFSYGEVTSTSEDGNSVEIIYSKDTEPTTVHKTSVTELNEIVGLENLQKAERWVRLTFGKKWAEKVEDFRTFFNAAMRFMVRLKDFTLLGFQNTSFAAKNYFGGRINLATYLPSDSTLWIPKNADVLYKEYVQSTVNPTSVEDKERKRFFTLLRDNSASVLGGFDKLLGAYSGIISEVMSDSEFSTRQLSIKLNLENKYDVLMPSNIKKGSEEEKKWKEDVEMMQAIANTSPESLMVAGFEPSKMKGVFDMLTEIYNRKGLYNVLSLTPFVDWKDAEWVSPLMAEQTNRFMTMAVTTDRLLRSIEYKEEDLPLITAVLDNYILSKLQQANQNTQFQYIPGLFLNHLDSTISGRFFYQYSHYGNSLNHAFYQRWNNIGEQAEMLGLNSKKWFPFHRTIRMAAMGDNIRYKVIKTVTEKYQDSDGKWKRREKDVEFTIREDNEARRAIKMFSFSLGLHFIKRAATALGKKAYLAAGSSAVFDWLLNFVGLNAVKAFTLPSMDFVFDLGRFLVNQFLRKDDDDDDDSWFNQKIYGRTTIESVILGKTADQYTEEERKIFERALGQDYSMLLDDNAIMKKYYREQAQTIMRDISFVGVELQTVLNMGIEMLLFAVYPDEYSFKDTALDEVQKFNQRTIPGLKIIKDTYHIPALNSFEQQVKEGYETKEELEPNLDNLEN